MKKKLLKSYFIYASFNNYKTKWKLKWKCKTWRRQGVFYQNKKYNNIKKHDLINLLNSQQKITNKKQKFYFKILFTNITRILFILIHVYIYIYKLYTY